MRKESYQFSYENYASISELGAEDKALLEAARQLTEQSYAPYSHFHVAAVAKLKNGQWVKGTNQENASYPVGICAERVLLASASMLFPNEQIDSMAITYHNFNGESNHPVSPCGMCRQSLVEYEARIGKSIRLILSGMDGEVMILDSSKQLLPFSFGGEDLK
jgi:cytidine deaminase